MNVYRVNSTLPCGRPRLGRPRNRSGIRPAHIVSFILVTSVIVSISGCIPVPRGDDPLDVRFMTRDELRDYSEQVFRRQNGLTTRLMMASPSRDALSESERRLIDKAESRMNEACASLNEIAAARAIGRDVDLELENSVRRTVRACAASARRLEDLLELHDIG